MCEKKGVKKGNGMKKNKQETGKKNWINGSSEKSLEFRSPTSHWCSSGVQHR